MRPLFAALIMIGLLTGCAARQGLDFAPADEAASVHPIWVANFRSREAAALGQKSRPRPQSLIFDVTKVSIPEDHKAGEIEWPTGKASAKTDFVTLSSTPIPDLEGFAKAVARSDETHQKNTLLFVHGFNMRHGEAVYQLAQVRHDFGITAPSVLFSWPSAGVSAGYVYDRDSVLIARDQLEQVILSLSRQSNRKITLMGHSMGNLLIMETLRQIEISGSLDIGRKIDALFMVSPDIDGELFRTQAERLRRLPDPSVIIATDHDRVLRLSAWLTGRTNRLGSVTDRTAVGDLPVSVVDVGRLARKGLNHNVALTSPTAISIFKKLSAQTAPGEFHLPPVLELTEEN